MTRAYRVKTVQRWMCAELWRALDRGTDEDFERTYAVWGFGDTWSDLLALVRRARAMEKVVAATESQPADGASDGAS